MSARAASIQGKKSRSVLDIKYRLPNRLSAKPIWPVIAVGLITGAHQAEAIIAEGKADMVAVARAVMDDPHWAWHSARELGEEIEYPRQICFELPPSFGQVQQI